MISLPVWSKMVGLAEFVEVALDPQDPPEF